MPSVNDQDPSRNHGLLIGAVVVIGSALVVAAAFIPAAFKAFKGTRPFRVVGRSMDPTLYEGDQITADASYYAGHPIEDGDIVVFRHNDKLLIKRVSAVGAEAIEGKGGKLIRNGATLAEPYLHTPDKPAPDDEANFTSHVIPKGELFVTGDWRSLSTDSRDPEYGPVKISDVLGKVVYVYSSSHPGQQGRRF